MEKETIYKEYFRILNLKNKLTNKSKDLSLEISKLNEEIIEGKKHLEDLLEDLKDVETEMSAKTRRLKIRIDDSIFLLIIFYAVIYYIKEKEVILVGAFFKLIHELLFVDWTKLIDLAIWVIAIWVGVYIISAVSRYIARFIINNKSIYEKQLKVATNQNKNLDKNIELLNLKEKEYYKVSEELNKCNEDFRILLESI